MVKQALCLRGSWSPRCGVLSRPNTYGYWGSLRPCPVATSGTPKTRPVPPSPPSRADLFRLGLAGPGVTLRCDRDLVRLAVARNDDGRRPARAEPGRRETVDRDLDGGRVRRLPRDGDGPGRRCSAVEVADVQGRELGVGHRRGRRLGRLRAGRGGRAARVVDRPVRSGGGGTTSPRRGSRP